MALVLIGFMGAGKSTAAIELGAALGQRVFDSDALLAEQFGHPVATEFELRGEESFRAAEERLVCELLDSACPEEIVALGGGSVLSSHVREALSRGHLTILLDVDPDVAWKRVAESGHGPSRPLAADRDAFLALYAERASLYEELADAVLPELPPQGIARVAASLRVLHNLPKDTRLLWARSASGEYPVLIGNSLLDQASHLMAVWPFDRERSRAFCVTDESVGALYGERLGAVATSIAIEPGESHKTLATAEHVWRELAQQGMTRADHVVALGGGVVGDLAGFCAATYQRGVPVVQVPTTLVAQVDSAYGGKTGVDLPDAKNYIGAYHQPAGVLVDPLALSSLPAPELAAGWVEVLKTALIAGGELWERVGSMSGCLPDAAVVRDCVATKLAIVREDERDCGRRQVLNLGHTVGHAIETVTGYARYRHGEAVGLGLLAALRLSGADGLREQVRELLAARDLPVTLGGDEDVSVDALLAATARDKKRLGIGSVPFVLVSSPGQAEIGQQIPESDLRAAVAELIP